MILFKKLKEWRKYSTPVYVLTEGNHEYNYLDHTHVIKLFVNVPSQSLVESPAQQFFSN